MAGEARSVVVRLTAETAQYIAQMQSAGRLSADAMTKVEKSVAKQSAAIDTLGSKAGKMALAAGGALAFLGKSAMDWESQWAGVRKTVDGTDQELADLEGQLRGLAKTMPATHQEIAGVAEAAGQLGVATQDVASFTETMVQLGETTNLTAQDAATSIAQMANVMGTAPDEISRVGAALVALGNDGASTERQIILMAQRISGAGAQIGLAESDILGIANAAASMGIEVEAGGTAISKVFTEMAKATAQGGQDLEAFADVAGMSGEAFTKAFQDDPAQAFAAFTAGLDRIKESGGDVFTTLDQLGMSDVRVSRALLSMASSGDLLTDSLQLGADAFEQNSALAEEYGKRVETTESQVRIAWNRIKESAIDAGAALLPVIADSADAVGDFAGAFQKLPGPVKSTATQLLGITTILGGATWFGSKVVGGVLSTNDALTQLGVIGGSTNRSLGRLVGTLGRIAGTVVAVRMLNDALDEVFDTRVDESTLTRDLEALARGEVTDNLSHLGADLRQLTSTLEDVKEPLGEAVHGFGLLGDTPMDKANENINKIDEALASMVESGNAERAAKIFDEILTIAKEKGVNVGDAADEFDRYQLALRNFEAANDRAARGSDLLPSFFDVLRREADGAANALDDVAASAGTSLDAMKQMMGFLDREEAMRNFRESVKDAADALKDGFKPEEIEVIDQIGRNIDAVQQTLAKKPAQARSALRLAREELEGLETSSPKAQKRIDELLKYVNRALDDMKGQPPAEVPVGLNTTEFDRDDAAVRRRHRALDALHANPEVDLNDALFATVFGLTAADIKWLDRQLATPKVDVDAGDSLSLLGRIAQGINNLHDRDVTITTYHRNVIENMIANKPKVPSADGSLYEGGMRRFAVGGAMDFGQGPRVPRNPMMVRGGANILWGEPETGWEAYISGKPGMRERNIDILRMAADRLGVAVTRFADGGTTGRGVDSSLVHAPGQLNAMSINQLVREWEWALHNATKGMREWTLEIRREFNRRARLAAKHTESVEKDLAKAKEVRDAWDSAIESLSQNVIGQLTSNLFGGSDQAGFGSVLEDLEDAEKRRSQEYMAAVEELRRIGLNEEALQAFLEESTAAQVIEFTKTHELTRDLVAGLNDAFAGQGSLFDQVMGVLSHDKALAEMFESATMRLSALGLDEDALQALIEQAGPERLIEIANTWTREQVGQFEQLFNQTQDSREAAGLKAGGLVFGERRDAAAEEVALLRADLREARDREERALELAEKADRRWERIERHFPERTGNAVAAALDDSGGRGSRREDRRRGK